MIRILLILSLVFFSSCNSSGDGEGGFAKLNPTPPDGDIVQVVRPEIETFSPITDPVVLLSNTERTFVVGLKSSSGSLGDINYEFRMNGNVVQSGKNSFYALNSLGVTPGAHTLSFKATNSAGEAQKTFNLFKNSPPILNLFSQTETTINCSSSSYTLNVFGSDPDGDAMTFSFLLNGFTNASFLSGTSGPNSASLTFTPNCSISGTNFVTIRATDVHGEYTDYIGNVTVTNPFSASIDAFSPMTEPTVVLSTSTVNFSIVPGGTSPFSYAWTISPGSTIASCSGSSTCPIQGSDFTPGRYILNSTLTDSTPTTANKAFTVVLNQRPQVTATPSNISPIKMNCSSLKNFDLTIEDANFGDNTQNFSVTWRLNGASHPALSTTTVLNAHPMTSTTTFSPACNQALIGDQTLSVVVTDGHESQEIIWPLNINYFSEVCNNLSLGQICTAAGRIGMAGSVNLATEMSKVNLQPWGLAKHSENAFFISDQHRDGIWFWNGSAAPITLFGSIVVPSNHLSYVLGQGSWGTNAPTTLGNIYFTDPRSIVYDSSSAVLYIAEVNTHRIIKIDNTGNVTVFAGGATAASSLANNTDGASRTSHRCITPLDMVLDASENKLFVTCWSNNGGEDGAVKYFRTDVDEGYTLVRYGNPAVMSSVGNRSTDGRSRRAYSIAKHPSKRILFVGELELCQIYAISYGDTETFYNGAKVLDANQMIRLTHNEGCGVNNAILYSDAGLRIRPNDLEVIPDGPNLRGLIMSNHDNSGLQFLNLSASDQTIGGRLIGSGRVDSVTLMSGSYGRGIPAFNETIFRNPWGLFLDGNKLYVNDVYNGFLSYYDISLPNGSFINVLGAQGIGFYDGEELASLNNRRFNRITKLEFNHHDESLYIIDEDNYRIRKLEMNSGRLDTVKGSGGWGNANINPSTSPTTAGSHHMYGLAIFPDDNILLYTDWNGGIGVNRNCHVRALNLTSGDVPSLGQLLESLRVRSVAGNYSLGCTVYSPGYEGQAGMSIAFNSPYGVMTNNDGSEIFISDRNSHCVYRQSSDGTIESVLGTCGASSDTPGSNLFSKDHRLTFPGFIKRDRHPSYSSSNNFFIVHRSRSGGSVITNSQIRYYNSTAQDVTFINDEIVVAPGEIRTILANLQYVNGIASFGDQICYTQGADQNGATVPHNVECVNRTSGAVTLRIGRSSAAQVKAFVQRAQEHEGVNASSASLSHAWDIEFDHEGNLWISEIYTNALRKVARWF